jgi:hypothetical protein
MPAHMKNRSGVNDWHPESTWDKEIRPEWPAACIQCASVVAWFGNWKRREHVSKAIGVPIRAEIVWAKDMHVGPPCPLAMQDERIWIYSATGINPRCFDTTVWNEPVIPTWNHRHHKNEKPIGLMRRLIRLLSDSGQIICDPFMGSGTTLRAAKDLGRKAIGIEIEERYCEIAANRLRQEVLF